MSDVQIANVIAALALHLTDQIREGGDAVANHGSAAPSALVVIYQHPGKTIDFLSKVLDMSHSGTVRLVDRILADGLITKAKGADARAVALTCTQAGAKKARNILSLRRRVVAPLVSALDEADKLNLQTILWKLPWDGVVSRDEGVHACRMCDINVCFVKGNCPVTIARLASSEAEAGGSVEACRHMRQSPYDPENPDACEGHQVVSSKRVLSRRKARS